MREKAVYAVAIKCYDKNRRNYLYDIKLKRFLRINIMQSIPYTIDPDLPFSTKTK